MKFLGDKARPTAVLVLILFFGISRQSSAAPVISKTNSTLVLNGLITLDPHYDSNLVALASIAETTAKREKKESKAEKKAAAKSDDLKNLPTAELQKRFPDDSAKHESRAISAMGKMAAEALHAENATERSACVADILEIQAGLRNAAEPLVPDRLGVFTTWVFFFKNLSGSIGHGHTVASNLIGAPNQDAGGRIDPLPSTFWTRPAAVGDEDLYAGFGRDQLPHLEDWICDYSAPKTSTGTHAGFDVEYKGDRYKIKFGDINSEPFTARIFFALGYHVDPTDYAPGVRIHYDRRMFREFHLRKPLAMRITPFGVHIGTVQLQTHYDPFAFVTSAVFKDGRKVSGTELKQMLFTDPKRAHPEDSPENFRPDIEATLDYLVMTPANVQPRDGPTQSIGAWKFGGLSHENLRELRGAGLLAAWLGWFDSRADNTKLRLERDASKVQLQHFISDLGGGMGAGTGLFSPRGENPNDFTWTFTAPEVIRGPGRMTTPFRIIHFKPTTPTAAFENMTADDARWMARLIGRLTENQLRAAMIASGYDNAESQIYLEKLISRRDRMIRDLNLENEIPLLHPDGQNRQFTYKPSVDGPFRTIVHGSAISARESSAIASEGHLIGR